MVHILKNYLCYLSGLEFEMLENYPENRYDVMLKTLKAYENREIPIIIKGGQTGRTGLSMAVCEWD